jgi:hypothetical protein
MVLKIEIKMNDNIGDDRDSLMRSSYYIITRNFTKTVNRFVVFRDGSNIIDIPHGIGQRSKFIDVLLQYFIELEEYEKCDVLSKLKELVIMAGD